MYGERVFEFTLKNGDKIECTIDELSYLHGLCEDDTIRRVFLYKQNEEF